MLSFNNQWDKIPTAEIESFINAFNNIAKNASAADLAEIEEFLSSIGYPISYGLPGHYEEYIAETPAVMFEVEDYIFSHD